MEDELNAVSAVADPGERAHRAGKLIEAHQRAIAGLAQIRREAMEELDRQGVSDAEIAQRAGVTRQRVGQILGHTAKIK